MWCPSGGSFPGYAIVGALLLASGTVIQWAVSTGAKDFSLRCFAGLCAGICIYGTAAIFGELIRQYAA